MAAAKPLCRTCLLYTSRKCVTELLSAGSSYAEGAETAKKLRRSDVPGRKDGYKRQRQGGAQDPQIYTANCFDCGGNGIFGSICLGCTLPCLLYTSPYYMEVKKAQAEAMKAAKARVLEVAAEYEKVSGRKYGLFEEYRMDDAEAAVVVIGSSAGTGKDAVDALREEGKKVGLIKLRVFRPFPMEELAVALSLIHI